jgi:two-component system, chemotaxis family, chemotaxis protein CheY
MKVLAAGDPVLMGVRCARMLRARGYSVAEAAGGLEAITRNRQGQPNLVRLDISMPDLDGLSALEQIGRDNPDARVMMVSALDQESVVLEVPRRGADYFLARPYDEHRLPGAIDNALR